MKTSRAVMMLASVVALGGACEPAHQELEVEAEAVRMHPVVARAAVKPEGVPAEFVATPAGFFHPSCLKHVDAQTTGQVHAAVASSPCSFPHYNAVGKPMPSADEGAGADPAAGAPAPGANIQAVDATPAGPAPLATTAKFSGWSMLDHTTIPLGVTKLTSQWTVPPTPARAGQVLFFFPGTEPSDWSHGGTILQPVLAYENAQWFVQSWNCCEEGNALYGDAVAVRPGDTIVGTNIGTNCNAATGICNNWRIVTADATTGGQSAFDTFSFNRAHNWIFGNVFEVYDLESCDQLPSSGGLTVHNFAIWDMQGRSINVPGLQWHDDVSQSLAGCGNPWSGSHSGTDFTVSWGGARGGGGGGTISIPFSGKCLDINANGSGNGTKIQEWGCHGGAAQQFRIVQAVNAAGAVNIVHTASNKCVDIAAAGTADFTKAQLWDCNNTGAQSFFKQDVGGGNVRFVNTNSNKCLDVNAAAGADGTQVQLYSCNNTVAQTWHVN
jgi:hypothetical protein